jgi:hypothetical protein
VTENGGDDVLGPRWIRVLCFLSLFLEVVSSKLQLRLCSLRPDSEANFNWVLNCVPAANQLVNRPLSEVPHGRKKKSVGVGSNQMHAILRNFSFLVFSFWFPLSVVLFSAGTV